jgi:tetratricopeptide (TPR) repeat protein
MNVMTGLRWRVTSVPETRNRGMHRSRYSTLSLKEARDASTRIEYEDDIVAAAESLCLDADDNRLPSDLLQVKGLSASRRGHVHIAAAYLKCALKRAPSAQRYADLADVLMLEGEGADGLSAALAALSQTPSDEMAYRRLGRALRKHSSTAAVAVYQLALRLDPRNPVVLIELADVLLALGRFDQAITTYDEAISLDSRNVRAYCGLGYAWNMCRKPEIALAILGRASVLDPTHAGVRGQVGHTLIRLRRYEEAADQLRASLNIEPRNASVCCDLVYALELLGRPSEAAAAWLALGEAMQLEARYEAAAHCYREACARHESLPGRLRLAHMLIATRHPHDAVRLLKPLVESGCQALAAHLDLATARYLIDDVDRAWDHFSRHYDTQDSVKRAFEQPLWDGSDLGGRTILLWASDGRGDVIQFLRYVRYAREQGGRVIVQCHHPGLIPLISRMPDVEGVVASTMPLPAFDVHAPLVFLPAFVRQARDYRVELPYLRPNSRLVRYWHQRLRPSADKIVGLSWGGEMSVAPSRFIYLKLFEILADVPGVRFVSLQHGPQTAELLNPQKTLRIERWMDYNSTIDEAAALIAELDLVISVDTMIAHLAGALGRPVWVLLRYATNWRWQLDRDETHWYPTMRLLRQRRIGDWNGVLLRVRELLLSSQSVR